MELAGTVVMIVGAGRGIGRTAALKFADAGADLVIASRNEAELAELEFKLERKGTSVLAVPTDATREEEVKRLTTEAMNRFGHIDVLVYTAGVGIIKPFAETSADEYDRLMNVNAKGAYLVLQSVLPVMEKQKSGKVIVIPGIVGRAPLAQAAAYCASKYALTGMIKALALEYKRAGVRFSLLHLGGVNTSFWDSITMRVQRDRMLTDREAADAVIFAASQSGEGVVNELVIQPESHQM